MAEEPLVGVEGTGAECTSRLSVIGQGDQKHFIVLEDGPREMAEQPLSTNYR